MAGRKKKNTVDYFPHYIGEGKKMRYIEAKYGNDGYASWFKILETLASAENHYINLNDDIESEILADKCKVSPDLLLSLLDDLSKLGAIDKFLWENKVIWSQVFVESIRDAYRKRISDFLDYSNLCRYLYDINVISSAGNTISSAGNAGKKKEEIKKEEIRNIPTESEFPTPSVERGIEVQKALTKLPWEQYSVLDFETPKNDLLNDLEFISRTATNNVISENQATEWIVKFFNHIETTKEGHMNLKSYRSHCTNWINLKIRNQNNSSYGKNQSNTRKHEPSKQIDSYGKL